MKRALIYIFLALAVAASAQLPHNYICDFENDAENALWTLNKPKNESYTWVNQWAIGSATASLGQKSLYISPDEGVTASYAKTESRVMIAWRELQLETGRYDLSFDWKCGGDSAYTTLLAAWVPEEDFGNMFCMLNDDYKAKKWVANNMLQFDSHGILSQMPIWTHAVDTIYSDGTPHRLVFLFVQSSTAQMKQPGACVDNIMLARNNCGEPTNKQVQMLGQAVSMSWQSDADTFNLRMLRMGDSEPKERLNITQNSYSESLPEGIYNIQIQVVCDGDTSAWYGFPPAIVHEARCFDYLDLTDDRCFYLDDTPSDYHNVDDSLAKVTPHKIDYGYTSVASRHTVHYVPDEIDARTLNSIDQDGNPVSPLKTIPDGALASVRIGSWEETARVVRVEYDFTIDAKEASVLMLQYAMVLQYAKHDEPHQRPRMMIDIVDATTNKSLEPCMVVDLASEVGGEGWFRVPYESANKVNARDVCWRDWKTMGLNLAEHHGKHVKVKITVLGCEMTAHYGYAYFVLTCTSGEIKGMHCGWEQTNEFIAPEGFNYHWYKVTEPKVKLKNEDQRIFPVNYDDTCAYAVDITYKTNKDCGFTLYASAVPRFPIPEATYKLEQHDCHNYITLYNTSHIRTYNYYTKEMIDTQVKPDYVGWGFGDLKPEYDPSKAPWEISFQLPDEEADYQFLLLAGVGLCDSMLVMNIHVPAVGPDSVPKRVERCEGDLYQYKGKYYMRDTLIIERDFNRAGCDSVHVIDLRFVDAIHDTAEVSIVDGETYEFAGQSLTKEGEYTGTFISAAGCDSIVLLRLKVFVPLTMEITAVESPCYGDASFLIETHARKGTPNAYTITFSEADTIAGLQPQSGTMSGGEENTLTINLSADVLPGFYPFTIEFGSENNGTTQVTDTLIIQYPATLIQQRWDDVLGILNAEYNGGYDFITFQWYRNSQPIEGANEPYLYIEEKLRAGDRYHVELGVTGDERTLTTCAYEIISDMPAASVSSRKLMQNGTMYIIVDDRRYNAQGIRVE